MSLMMSVCCCGGGGGCDTAPTCDCLATSISIAIPAWTYIAASCPAQTVVAHLCCFTDGGIDYQVYQYTVPDYPPAMCYLCVKNPLTIDSSTSCDGITTNNLCSFSNTFVSNPALSFFTDADCVNCTGLLLQNYVSHLSVNSLSNNCDKPSSVTITFGTTPIVLTIT